MLEIVLQIWIFTMFTFFKPVQHYVLIQKWNLNPPSKNLWVLSSKYYSFLKIVDFVILFVLSKQVFFFLCFQLIKFYLEHGRKWSFFYVSICFIYFLDLDSRSYNSIHFRVTNSFLEIYSIFLLLDGVGVLMMAFKTLWV